MNEICGGIDTAIDVGCVSPVKSNCCTRKVNCSQVSTIVRRPKYIYDCCLYNADYFTIGFLHKSFFCMELELPENAEEAYMVDCIPLKCGAQIDVSFSRLMQPALKLGEEKNPCCICMELKGRTRRIHLDDRAGQTTLIRFGVRVCSSPFNSGFTRTQRIDYLIERYLVRIK